MKSKFSKFKPRSGEILYLPADLRISIPTLYHWNYSRSLFPFTTAWYCILQNSLPARSPQIIIKHCFMWQLSSHSFVNWFLVSTLQIQ